MCPPRVCVYSSIALTLTTWYCSRCFRSREPRVRPVFDKERAKSITRLAKDPSNRLEPELTVVSTWRQHGAMSVPYYYEIPRQPPCQSVNTMSESCRRSIPCRHHVNSISTPCHNADAFQKCAGCDTHTDGHQFRPVLRRQQGNKKYLSMHLDCNLYVQSAALCSYSSSRDITLVSLATFLSQALFCTA